MKAVIIAFAALIALVCSMPTEMRNYVKMFEDFKAKHGRKYASASEEAMRLRHFVSNMKKAEKLAKLNPLATFGANEFADMSAAEFKVRHSAEKHYKAKAANRKPVANMFTEEQVKAAASSIDWRAKGAVTYVKNQGQCGSCWSFSSTGSIEGQWFLAGNTLVALSEQELVSCDTTDDDAARRREGPARAALALVLHVRHGALRAPVDARRGGLHLLLREHVRHGLAVGNLGLVVLNEDQMATWMSTNGPISIGVDATSWQTYTSGIMTNCISSQVDHGVLAVGFDNTNSPPYWIIKNSWA
eukprot:CAMPEP_0176445430 /NCGR_PEP_ID=MMETSP0127-20121128/23697_1 /TAXON_ID=938130 /ORGANISM="Platyophrya macrostoma, Strain WH" /LENGTH=300 /DNA_ID=CAMNT_0017831215 /DNA_START=49 /DNA_END=947 /DNA_ORIENTATION=+